MVLCCHTTSFRQPGWDAVLVRPGWAGVDLFFVLSGYLISGLLFAEYKKTGMIRFRRFAFRRAFKIYPAFYVLVLLTVLFRLAHHRIGPAPILRGLLHDVFFLQSYTPGTYLHFWSLAVEEHFYILLPLMLYFLLRRSEPHESDPFRYLPRLFALVAAVALALRLWTSHSGGTFQVQTQLTPTHLRIDSLLFGVVLSYWSSFHAARFWGFARARYPLILAAGIVLLAPLVLIDVTDRWMYTYGFALNYLGFGTLMVGMLSLPLERLPRAGQAGFRFLGYIGTFSYSIYLWHLAWIEAILRLHIAALPYVGIFAYFAGSIVIGIVTSKLIEIPSLRLRERLFPQAEAKTRAVSFATAVSLVDAPMPR